MSSQGELTTVKLPMSRAALPYQAPPSLTTVAGLGPVLRAELPDGGLAWLIVGFDEVRQVLTDHRFSRELADHSDRVRDTAVGPVPADKTTATTAMPRQLRQLVARAFSARSVEQFRPQVRLTVAELLDAMRAGPRPADLVRAFSLPLPARVLFKLLGLPTSTWDPYLNWSQALMSEDQEQIAAAYQAIEKYMTGLLTVKRSQPADDLISALISNGGGSGGPTTEEIVALCGGLLFAGHETTPNSIEVSLLTLFDNPSELARLRGDQSLIPGAVEELLRHSHQGISIPAARITTEDVIIGGVTIPAREIVLTLNYVANHDPTVFDIPIRLDVARSISPHLAFGAGAHYCLGAQLVRVELQEALHGLLWGLPGLRLAIPAEELRFRQRALLSSPQEIPVTWDER